MIVAAVLVAGGDGRRLGADRPKAFVEVAGRTLLEHAVGRFAAHPLVRDVIVAAPAGFVPQARALVPSATVVSGGATRQRSVALALTAVAPDIDLVLVHDVARAFVPAAVVTRVIEALVAGAGAVVPTLAVTDTIRTVDTTTGELGELIDRSGLLAMQTPQGFRRDQLLKAHEAGEGADATDDAALVEAIGGEVLAVAGDERARKITVPLDLALAAVLEQPADADDCSAEDCSADDCSADD